MCGMVMVFVGRQHRKISICKVCVRMGVVMLDCDVHLFFVFLETNGRFSYYLEQIRKAKEEYVPCNITNCQCYLPVIQNDLKTFKSGVTKKLLDNVKLKLVLLFLFVNKTWLLFLFFQGHCVSDNRP